MGRIVDVATAIVIVAAIMVMVRPGSQGPALITSAGNAFTGAIGGATGGGAFNPPGGGQKGH
jgi:hypothetical protein